MHGDDVASAGVSVSTQIVSKATEILLDMLKVAIEKEREAARKKQSEKQQVLSGGEVTYQKLKEGGEVAMLPSFDRDDYGEFLKRAKEMDIPVAAIQEHGKENTLSLFFNVKDKEAVNAIVQDIVREKLKQPEQTERMITIEKEQVEGFQMYCSDHDIPVNFMETQNGVKCIFGAAYEKQMEAAVQTATNKYAHILSIAKQYVQNNYNRDISMDEVAEMVSMSYSYFSRVFKEQLHQSFSEYVLSVRMREAKRLMEEDPAIKIKEVAELVGYESVYTFSRAYKQYYHVSPKQDRDG